MTVTSLLSVVSCFCGCAGVGAGVWVCVGARVGLCGRVCAPASGGENTEATLASKTTAIEARARVIRIRSAPRSEGKTHASSHLFQLARFIAPGELAQHLTDQEQRAGDADHWCRREAPCARERVGRRAG